MTKRKAKHVKRTFSQEEKAEHARLREEIEREFPPGRAEVPPDDPSHPPTLGDYFDLRQLAGDLRKAREAQGISLTDLQKATGIDKAALSRIETGQNLNPTVGTLARYAQAVGRRIDFQLAELEPAEVKP